MDSFPLLRIDDCIDHIGQAKFVTKLDLLKGYWQVPLIDRAFEISTCFSAIQGPRFWPEKCSCHFQRLMSKVLTNVKNCQACLDYVVCYSEALKSHFKTQKKLISPLV